MRIKPPIRYDFRESKIRDADDIAIACDVSDDDAQDLVDAFNKLHPLISTPEEEEEERKQREAVEKRREINLRLKEAKEAQENKIASIRSLRRNGLSAEYLGRLFGVSLGAIKEITGEQDEDERDEYWDEYG